MYMIEIHGNTIGGWELLISNPKWISTL